MPLASCLEQSVVACDRDPHRALPGWLLPPGAVLEGASSDPGRAGQDQPQRRARSRSSNSPTNPSFTLIEWSVSDFLRSGMATNLVPLSLKPQVVTLSRSEEEETFTYPGSIVFLRPFFSPQPIALWQVQIASSAPPGSSVSGQRPSSLRLYSSSAQTYPAVVPTAASWLPKYACERLRSLCVCLILPWLGGHCEDSILQGP
jgi:hypothetical protein